MKKKLSIKLYVSIIFLSLTALLVIGYSLLSARYYQLGADAITASEMVKAATEYLGTNKLKSGLPAVDYKGNFLAKQWGDMPGSIRSQISEKPSVPGKLQIVAESGFLKPPDRITFAVLYQYGEELFYIARQDSRQLASTTLINQDAVDTVLMKNAERSLFTLLIVTLFSALIIGLITWLILRQVSKPVTALGEWARNLDGEKLQQQPPDFLYPELNELAGLIRSSLTAVQEGLDREHRFLRHASHELRTPISIIRNNVELIKKLKVHSSPDENENTKQQQVIDRIDRASLNMKHMTETLLWLSRDDDSKLPTRKVRLDYLVEELSENLRYLTNGKEVSINIKTSPCRIEIPETVASIILGNLIRNAFQHTFSGSISIKQQDNKVTIINSYPNEVHTEEDLGFGLGLQLTRLLSEKIGWPYENRQEPSGNIASITLSEGQPSPTLPQNV